MSRGRATAVLGALALTFAIQEAALRFAFPLPEVRGFNRIAYMDVGLEGAETRAIRSIKVLVDDAVDGVKVVHALNEYGFRGGRWPARPAAGTRRVMFVGDSFVEGGLTPDGQTLPEGFVAEAGRRGVRVEALNLGVSGGDLKSAARLILDAAPLLRPDAVFLVIYANDLPDEVDPGEPARFGHYAELKPRFLELLRMAREREQLPWRWPWRTVNFLQPVPSPNNPWSDPQFEAANRASVRPDVLAAMKAARFSPYRMGGSRYLEGDLQRPFDIRDALGRLRRQLERLGCRIVVLYIPERGMVTNHYRDFEQAFSQGYPEVDLTGPRYQQHRQLLSEQCAGQGVPFLDLTDFIRGEEEAGRHLYFRYDDHLTGEASHRVGALAFQRFAEALGGR